MLRETNVRYDHWADKTMSVLHERQLEACESRLSVLPDFDMFQASDNSRAEQLWAISHDAFEHPKAETLHTVDQLKETVLERLPAECALVTMQEHLMMEKLIVHDGIAELTDIEEAAPAESLVRRLWCYLEWAEDDRLFLHLSPALLKPLAGLMADEIHQELRERLIRFDMTLRGYLYIHGIVPFNFALQHLLRDAVETSDPEDVRLCERYLRVSFDYICRMDGSRYLLHPGLADPEPLIACMGAVAQADLDEMTLLSAIAGILPEEAESTLTMIGLMQDATRPELTEDEAVQDLRILAKQGVGLHDLQEVLASLLTQQPTPAMTEGLRNLASQTVRWAGTKAAVLN